jgi:16S rRNA (adenine1518-N6/adenine1519-N6)-dimethyltransferase
VIWHAGALPAPRKRLGQHFLHDRSVIARIVDAVTLAPDERLVEIGPGRGAITLPLLARHGALTAIEFDRDLARHWRGLAGSEFPGLTLLEEDALAVDWRALAAGATLVVVGNLPYNIATAILFALIETPAAVREMVFMVQLEVAERIAAAPGSRAYGRLSVMVQQHCRVERLLRIGPGAFHPPPKVDSAVLRITPRPRSERDATPPMLGPVVAAAFRARRKTLRNALAGLLAPEAMMALGIDPSARGETLRVEDFVALARSVELAEP